MVLQRILTRNPQPDKRLRPDSSHRRMALLNCPTVSKCLAVSGVSPLGQRDRRDKRDTLYFYFFNSSLQYPSECCPFIKTFFYICESGGFMPSDITYCESVFRRSFIENVEVFFAIRTIRTTLTFV